MSTSIGTGGYISNEQYLAWMTEHTGELYDQMGQAMDIAGQRTDIQADLATIKNKLQDAGTGANGDPEQWAAVRSDMEALLAKYEGHPDAAQLHAVLDPMLDQMQFEVLTAAAARKLLAENLNADLDKYRGPSKDDVKKWSDRLTETSDTLGKQDQLALIQIQELNSRVNQATQLASNLIASANQTANSLVNNIKA